MSKNSSENKIDIYAVFKYIDNNKLIGILLILTLLVVAMLYQNPNFFDRLVQKGQREVIYDLSDQEKNKKQKVSEELNLNNAHFKTIKQNDINKDSAHAKLNNNIIESQNYLPPDRPSVSKSEAINEY